MSHIQNEKESDSFETDGSFTHRPLIRENKTPPVEVDSAEVNRLGEAHPHATLGNTATGAQLGEAFEHDENYDWSKDPRSESFNEKIAAEDEQRDDRYIATQMRQALEKHPDIDLSKVTSRVENGLIFLSGEVSTKRELDIIKKITQEIYGATGVMNTINIHQVSQLETRGLLKGLH